MIYDFSQVWLNLLDTILVRGQTVAPRGKPTKELPQHTIVVDMRYPVLRVEKRKLNYKFMAAEAFWIISGDDTVEGIARYNSRIADFSDDGVRFFGAYGPKIVGQIPFVVNKLNEDPMSRQAGLTIWRESPPPTKDVPCTVSMFFSIRDGKLNCHVFMRSNDAWLGTPYDVFNFSMVSHYICGLLNETKLTGDFVEPGLLYHTAASMHLYQENIELAVECFTAPPPLDQAPTPKFLWRDSKMCLDWLRGLRDTQPGDIHRWWENSSATN